MATLRNLAISIYKMAGVTNIAKATRTTGNQPFHALKLAGISLS